MVVLVSQRASIDFKGFFCSRVCKFRKMAFFDTFKIVNWLTHNLSLTLFGTASGVLSAGVYYAPCHRTFISACKIKTVQIKSCQWQVFMRKAMKHNEFKWQRRMNWCWNWSPFLTTCAFWPKGMGFIRVNALTLRAAFGITIAFSLRLQSPNQWFIHLISDHK